MKKRGFHKSQHEFQLFSPGVSGSMNVGDLFINHVRSHTVELVDQGCDGLLISGNEAGGKNHRVSILDLYVFVLIQGHAGKGRHRFSLTPGGDDGHLVIRIIADLFFRDFEVFGKVYESQFLGYAHIGDHAPSIKDHFSAKFGRKRNNLLNPGDVGGETGNNDSSLAFPEQVLQGLSHLHLAQGEPLLFRIGGIGEQGQDPLLAKMGEADDVRMLGIHRGGVDPEISGVYQYAFGCVDGKPNAVDDAVIYADILHLEWADIRNIALADLSSNPLFQAADVL